MKYNPYFCDVNDNGGYKAFFVGGEHPIIPEIPLNILVPDPNNAIQIDYVVHKKGQESEIAPLH